jgi:hypothetical protein
VLRPAYASFLNRNHRHSIASAKSRRIALLVGASRVIHVVTAVITAEGESKMTTSITETKETAQATAAATEKQEEPPKKATARAQKPRVAASKGKATKKASPAKKDAVGAKGAKKVAKPGKRRPDGARQGSKTEKVLDLLKRSGGATLAEIMKATDWQAHSVRGFISGTLGKKMALTVESAKNDNGERVYSIAK